MWGHNRKVGDIKIFGGSEKIMWRNIFYARGDFLIPVNICRGWTFEGARNYCDIGASRQHYSPHLQIACDAKKVMQTTCIAPCMVYKPP